MSDKLQKFQERAMQKQGGGFSSDAANAGVALGHTMVNQAIGGVITSVGIQHDRDLEQIMVRIEKEAKLAPEKLLYQWTTGGKKAGTVKGLTIDAAMILARNYGNSATWANVTSESNTHWNFTGFFLDRETGSLFMREYRQRKSTGNMGKMDSDRAEDIKFQVGQSKAIRNVVLKGMPEAMKTKLEEVALREGGKQLAQGGKEAAAKRVEDAFKPYNVTLDMLEAKMGKPQKEWRGSDYGALKAILNAIEDGQTTVANEFTLVAAIEGDKESADKSDDTSQG